MDVLRSFKIYYKEFQKEPFIVIERAAWAFDSDIIEKVTIGYTEWKTIISHNKQILSALKEGLSCPDAAPPIERLLKACNTPAFISRWKEHETWWG